MALVVAETPDVGVTVGESRQLHEAVEIALDELQVRRSPLREAVKASHVQVLAQIEDRWPPILVTRAHLEIVDGLHRYHAALLLGKSTIECLFFDGDSQDALSNRCAATLGMVCP